jgi:fused signal recognition particle receptor
VIAADTFRAAAVEQLKIWTERSGVRLFSGPDGCDSAGLCYDGLNAALKNGDDIVFIDTAGRLQNKNNLMEELKKIVRVIQKIIPDAPHSTILTIDATTGQNALSQAQIFKDACQVTGIILTKMDGTAKGGIALAVQSELGIPVKYIGIGEKASDLKKFDAKEYVDSIFAE